MVVWLLCTVALAAPPEKVGRFRLQHDAPLLAGQATGNEGLRVTTYEHESGLLVAVIPEKGQKTAAVQLWYRVGLADDPAGQSGATALVAALMDAPGKKQKLGFRRAVEARGGRTRTAQGPDWTVFATELRATDVVWVLGRETSRMSRLAPTPESIPKARDRLRAHTSLDTWIDAEARRRAFAQHPYGRTSLTPAPLARFGAGDAVQLHRAWFAPNNAMIVLCGGFDAVPTLKALDKLLGRAAPRRITQAHRTPDPAQLGPIQLELPALSAKGLLLVGHKAPGYADARHPAMLAALHALTAGPGARLARALPGAGLRTAAVAHRSASLQTFIVDLPPQGSAEGTIRTLLGALEKLAEVGPDKDEITAARNALVIGAMSRLGSPEGRAWTLGQGWVLTGNPLHYQKRIQVYDRLTRDSVRQAARAVFAPVRRTTAISGSRP